MDCTKVRDTIEKLHGRETMRRVGETTRDIAIEHMMGCSLCVVWFSSDMCAKVRRLNDEEVCMMHLMLHEPLETECEVV